MIKKSITINSLPLVITEGSSFSIVKDAIVTGFDNESSTNKTIYWMIDLSQTNNFDFGGYLVRQQPANWNWETQSFESWEDIDFTKGEFNFSDGEWGSNLFDQLTIHVDRVTEGPEIFKINYYSDKERTNQIGTSNEVVILDSSRTSEDSSFHEKGPIINGPGVDAGERASFISLIENTREVFRFTADKTAYWTMDGGPDADKLTINLMTGELSFINAPNFHSPVDSNEDNQYYFWIKARDGYGLQRSQEVTISIHDADAAAANEFIATISGTSGTDNLESTISNDSIDGGYGIDTIAYSGNFSNYSFTRATDTLEIIDQRTTGTTDGTDTLKNIEYIEFADQTIVSSKVDVVKTYSGNFSDYKFYNNGDGNYLIQTASETNAVFNKYDNITGYPLLTFTGEEDSSAFRDVSAIVDIKGTFDQVTGLDTDSGRMFRLYNASFKRLPDPDGLKYWIDNFSSGRNTIRVVASSFLESAEFKQRYGEDVSDSTFVNTLYKNVLGRDADASGLNYWLGQLSSGAETRYEALLGFAESSENKGLFTDMTGVFK